MGPTVEQLDKQNIKDKLLSNNKNRLKHSATFDKTAHEQKKNKKTG